MPIENNMYSIYQKCFNIEVQNKINHNKFDKANNTYFLILFKRSIICYGRESYFVENISNHQNRKIKFSLSMVKNRY